MKFIKVTSKQQEKTFYINEKHIQCFFRKEEGSRIVFSENDADYLDVKETPEEILELLK